jgi:hypothetical protein
MHPFPNAFWLLIIRNQWTLIQAGAAMALYLQGCSTAEIKMTGLWVVEIRCHAYLPPTTGN